MATLAPLGPTDAAHDTHTKAAKIMVNTIFIYLVLHFQDFVVHNYYLCVSLSRNQEKGGKAEKGTGYFFW
jgi:hypothetical protein